ncbi:hypothetical protein CCHL11_02039 [Colletotrichum chlorophyti]|uniref:Uncharacterized protein n=1 Tax=Colletotrichum chlorophyti TaxID=708187 RepID=A0A1Q8S6L8_9PEZI|nr:hypothetical protein CCHL11_02039 [Colletotrichum chlorophyti]
MAPTSPYFHHLISSWPTIGFAASGFVLLLIITSRAFISIPYPPGMRLVGEPKGATRFSIRTRLRYYIDCEGLFREAHDNYSKKGIPVVIPSLGFRHSVILPISYMRWILNQSEQHLLLGEAFAEVDQVQWAMGHDRYVVDGWQGLLVKTELNTVLERICASLNDELGPAFDKRLGTDTDWKEVDVLTATRLVVTQASSRFMVGLPLCRNEEYVRITVDINESLVSTLASLEVVPEFCDLSSEPW